jgi:NADPH-ferrihemoprotein reductase
VLPAAAQAGVSLGPVVLFFGCHSPRHDYLYQQRLEGWRASGVLGSLAVAFSREGPCKVSRP